MGTGIRRIRYLALAGFAVLVLAPAGGRALAADPPFRMTLPIACEPGRDCWIVNYFDNDPSSGLRDYACGRATYNGADGKAHNGTDFAIRDGAAMRTGVAVLAAAAGTVKAVRDGMADADILAGAPPPAPGGKDCGNGVVIEHGNGWETQYCHLRRGSVAVQPRQTVAVGQPIGLVGLSGFTDFPHVHVTVRHSGKAIDPFIGLVPTAGCGLGQAPLWDAATLARLPYAPTAIDNAGFAAEKATRNKARNGDYAADVLDRRSPVLVLWADLFNVRAGDRVVLTIRQPDGRVLVEHAAPVEKDHARQFLYAGRPLKAEAWPAGVYTGTVRVDRPDAGGPPAPAPVQARITVR